MQVLQIFWQILTWSRDSLRQFFALSQQLESTPERWKKIALILSYFLPDYPYHALIYLNKKNNKVPIFSFEHNCFYEYSCDIKQKSVSWIDLENILQTALVSVPIRLISAQLTSEKCNEHSKVSHKL